MPIDIRLFLPDAFTQASPAVCEAQLVAALEKRLTDFKNFQAQKDAGGGGAASGNSAATTRSTVAQQLGTLQLPGSTSVVGAEEALRGVSVIALYFAADWCGPCRQFTPSLKKYHHMVKDFKKRGFEVVWVSGSKNQAGFDSYFQVVEEMLVLSS
jgi:thiol-disulfide isomerase/thioredoxin